MTRKKMAATKAKSKYLAHHAEPEAHWVHALESRPNRYAQVLVIPAYAEGKGLFHTLSTIPKQPDGPVLTILVINASCDAPPWAHIANQETLRTLTTPNVPTDELAAGAFLRPHPSGDLLVIDRATNDRLFPKSEGVGLARKLGADLALAASTSGVVMSDWIHCSDADVEFPENYFDQTRGPSDQQVAARLYRFRHRPDSQGREYDAALQYEISLRYYVLGLRFAGSSYAFHSIGSTLALHTESYAQVRGFPRRQAAEDFYLLNKLAKVGRVESLKGDPIRPSSRVSSRVPFGTGAAIGRMLKNPSAERATYHPELFAYLRVWQQAIERAFAGPNSATALRGFVERAADETPCVELELLLACLDETGLLASAGKALEAPARVAKRQFRDVFDGFRTLKLIHALRGHNLADLPLREALSRAPFITLPDDPWAIPTPDLAQCVEKLEADISANEVYESKSPSDDG